MVPVWHPDVKNQNPKNPADEYGQLSTGDDILKSLVEHGPTRSPALQPAERASATNSNSSMSNTVTRISVD